MTALQKRKTLLQAMALADAARYIARRQGDAEVACALQRDYEEAAAKHAALLATTRS